MNFNVQKKQRALEEVYLRGFHTLNLCPKINQIRCRWGCHILTPKRPNHLQESIPKLQIVQWEQDFET